MKFGTLQVALLTGETREFPIDLPSVIVGRGEGVTILLDDFSISRRHARLTVDSGRLMVEDLASAAGTFINGERLSPNIRYLVDDGAELRFGDLEAGYAPPPPAEAVTASREEDGAETSPTGLHVALVSPAVAIDPGRQATATITVTNRGRVVDTVSIEVTDLPPEWYTIETSRASLLPGAQLSVQVTLHPPRRHDSLAGHYDFTVRVNSQEQQREAIAIGSFEVQAFEAFGLAFEAIRSGRNFRLIAENRGNEPARYALEGRDEEQAFRYLFDTPAVQLQPGQKQVVALKVRRPRQLFGPKIAHPFEVIGTAATGSEVRARGQLSVDPPLQKFRMPAMFALAALILGVTALGILILTDGESVQTAGAEDEYAGVHLCDEDDGQAEQEERNQDAASEAPNTSAVVAGLYDGGRPVFGQTDANGAPFFAQSDPRWGSVEYARSTELPNGKDWCGTTISQCGCAMTSVAVMLALYNVVNLPDGQPLTPQSLNAWFNGEARRTDRGWVSRGYIYGDVIWTAANELSGEIARANPGTPTVRFVRTGTGSEDEIRAELRAGRPIILEVPGHWIAAVGLDGDTILINDPFYRDRTTLDAYKGKVRSSVLYETSADLSAVVLTAPADVKFKVTDRQGRVVSTGEAADGGTGEPVNQIPGASFSAHRAWRDPTCIEKAPPTDAGTNQIMLPGSRDDYTIEILGTGDQTGSIAIHTYGRDGTGSIATIEGQEGTTAELGYDPNAPQPTVRVPNGNVTATVTPDSGGEGGGPGDETPTPAPTPSATPTPTGTPFVESRTNITLSAEPGQTRVETADNAGFELGDPIRFAPGLPNEEDNLIVGFGSFLLATPLKFAHGPGEPILRLPRPPGQGPGLPPGITPPAQTGPLLPPDTVGMACSTIYQPSPKQATFICDLQVTGDYTNTRWSLNGQTVTDFTGSSSFLMAFNTDTPATVSATVCNVTICRSVTRAERIVFPANLGGTTFTGPGGTSGTGAPPVVTPPAGGAVAIVCGTEFPITPDGQLAQFTCQASFSGDFTSISWSAPGGTPANQSGLSKTFTTTVRNVEGAPVSLKVTATVCNFGTCRTSEPTTVGIGRTITTLESSPDGQVNSGHRLTLMARVDGIGGVVPQGGTVQFYADGFAIGASATLFTVGKVAVAQAAVETTGLTSGDPEGSGIDHVFVGKYSGGINAFGSDSLERIITVLPPIKDGCDSVDEDNDGIVDNTCRNVVSPSTGFATAGSFATPKNLGGGTVLQTLSLAGGLDGSTATTLILRPGAPFTVSGSAGRTDYCPGCIRQVYIGIGGNQTSGTPPIGPKCVVSGGLPLHTVTNVPFSVPFNAPDKPGVYYLRATTTLDYFCVGPQVGPPENSIGRIVVEEPVGAELQIWSVPGSLWDTLDPNATGPSDPKLLSEIPSSGQVMLRAITSPTVPHGRVEFVTVPPATSVSDAMLTLPPPNQNTIVLLQQVCPASGMLGDQTCIPGEARLIVQAGGAARGETFSVTAALESDELELPTGQSGFADFTIRFPQVPPPASNTKSLSVLLPSVTGVTASPTGDVAICATAPPACTPVVLTASVSAPAPLTETPTGGSVEFYWKPESGGSWTLLGTDSTVVDGAASLDVQAGLGTAYLGDVVFQARFKRGSTNFEDSESAASDTVKFVRAPATASVVSVTAATDGKIGDGITLLARVAGGNGFDPTGGTVEFKARRSTEQIGSAASLGAPVTLALDAGTGEWRASLTFTTGTAPVADAGTYLFTAHLGQTSTLAADVSDDFSFTLTPQDPSITVTLPNSGTITVGATGSIRVELTTAGTASRLNDNSATIQFRHNGTALPGGTVAVTNLGSSVYGALYSVSALAAGTYSITAHYSGNNYFNAVTSSPAQTFAVNRFDPTVAVNTITSVQVGNNLSLSATISGTGLSCPGIRCPAGGTISFYKDSVTAGNLLGTSAAISTTSGSVSISTGGTTLLPSAGDYTIVARYNGDATNGNVAAATSASATATLTKRTPTVTTDNVTGALGTSIKLSATVSSGSASVSPACTSCLQFKVGASESAAVAIGSKVNVLSDGKAELPSVATGTGGAGEPFPSNGTYTIWAVYDANTNLNTANDSATVTIGPPPPTVSLSDATMPLNGTTNLVAVITPPSGRNPTCTACVAFKVGSSLETATTFATGSVALVSSEYRASVLITGGTPEFNAIQSYTVWAVYQPTGGTGESGASDDVGGPASDSATVTVTARTVTVTVSATTSMVVNAAQTLSVTVSPSGAPGTIQFKVNGTDQGTAQTLASGAASVSWTPTSTGSYNITATYTSTDTGYASQSTSNTVAVTVSPIATTLTVTGPATGVKDTALTLSANVAPSAAPGTIKFFADGTEVGQATFSGTQVSVQWTPTTAKTYTITATFTSTSGNYADDLTSNEVPISISAT